MLIHFVFQLSAQTQRPLRLLGFLSNSHNRRDAAYAEVAQRIEHLPDSRAMDKVSRQLESI